MTRQEQSKMLRLEAENKHLKEVVEKQMSIFREQLYEIVTLRTKLELIQHAMEYGE